MQGPIGKSLTTAVFEYRNAANSAFVIEPRLSRGGTPAAARSGGGDDDGGDDKPLARPSGAAALREEDEPDRERGITKQKEGKMPTKT